MKRNKLHFLALICMLCCTIDASVSNGSIKFEVIADWGGYPIFPYKSFVELAVGREMAKLASSIGIDCILALGDNFYLNGVKNVDDPRFKETFETAFDYPSLYVPWLVVAGNHDHYGNVSGQIAYTKKSKRWYFPDLYYKKTFPIPLSNLTVDVIMIDTVVLCGNTDPLDPYKQPEIKTKFWRQREDHWTWLESTLSESRANYLLVCGHYPVYSISSHGSTECLVKRLRPLLEKYEVTAYLSGHDHNLQHIQVKNSMSTMDYFVIGCTNFIDPSMINEYKVPSNSLLFHWGNPFSLGAFSYVDFNKVNMTITFIMSNGKIMYSYSKYPRYY